MPPAKATSPVPRVVDDAIADEGVVGAARDRHADACSAGVPLGGLAGQNASLSLKAVAEEAPVAGDVARRR